jgi:hypothetical protein
MIKGVVPRLGIDIQMLDGGDLEPIPKMVDRHIA